MPTPQLIYLAAPYSHTDPAFVECRVKQINRFAAKMVERGLVVYSPISHSHPIAMANRKLGTDWKAWSTIAIEMLRRSDLLWVLRLKGWEQSVGIMHETQYAQSIGIPTQYVEETYLD